MMALNPNAMRFVPGRRYHSTLDPTAVSFVPGREEHPSKDSPEKNSSCPNLGQLPAELRMEILSHILHIGYPIDT